MFVLYYISHNRLYFNIPLSMLNLSRFDELDLSYNYFPDNLNGVSLTDKASIQFKAERN